MLQLCLLASCPYFSVNFCPYLNIRVKELPYRRYVLYSVLHIYSVYENTVEFMIVILTLLASELFCQLIKAQKDEVKCHC